LEKLGLGRGGSSWPFAPGNGEDACPGLVLKKWKLRGRGE
jgi:hypothetical protein